MAFIKESGVIVSFAEYQDALDRDQRIFDANQGLNDDYLIETHLKRATQRILSKIKATSWWLEVTNSTPATAPSVDPEKIIARLDDFIDLCVYTAMGESILPIVADFGSEDNSERQKMEYYNTKATDRFNELISLGDWYDLTGSGTITKDDIHAGIYMRRRVR